MSYEIEWRPGAIEDITALFEYLVENAFLWDARNVTERLITATDRLADYPRLYETDERYGEGGRRISLLGQHVLYEVNDEASRVNILGACLRFCVNAFLRSDRPGGHRTR
ncbi:type II toxin-antitoxin system RelE/ParE family toxin [Escherichia coli]